MSGPNPPGPEPDEPEPGSGPGEDETEIDGGEEQQAEPADDGGESTSVTDVHSQAYSAPESEHFTSGPYVPADLGLYDYDSYHKPAEEEDHTPRWPWVVGIAAIGAAIALVVSVSLLVARTDTNERATPTAAPTSTPFQDEITVTTTTAPPSSRTSQVPLPPPPPSTVTVTESPPPPPTSEAPPPPATAAPSSTPTAAPPPATSAAPPAPPAPRQVTYSVTGTKAPLDVITVTYVDASGQRRTQRNVFIPWSLTLTPISQSEVGSVEASSLLRLSKLNCSITTSDGTVLSSNNGDLPQTSC
jgi:hypothetical protein